MPTRGRTATSVTLLALGVGLGLVTVWWFAHDRHPDRRRLVSRALGEARRILVHVPAGTEPVAGPYPLLVLLDGGDRRQFSGDRPLYSRSLEVLAALEKEGFPRMILVGVDNRDRVRDMTPVERPGIYVGGGGAEAFTRFVEDEVVPFVEARWRVSPTRILYGESYGGLFVLDALSRGRQAFTDYVAVSPAVGIWPDALASSLCRRFARPAPVRSVTIIYGERDAPLVVDYTPTFVRTITGCTAAELRIEMNVLPGEGHNPASSLERALRAIFRGDAKGMTSPARPP